MLLVSWLNLAKLDRRQYTFVEVFAGEACVSSELRRAKQSVASLGIQYDEVTNKPGAMDLTTPAGFVPLGP